jgi:ribosomal protein S18 acetylase RimI-like enzyme
MKSTFLPNQTHIRRVDVQHDLFEVADLIELCFMNQMDEDGLTYLKQIRRAAHDPRLVRWISAAGELFSYPVHGFVWEEEGRVIGNLNLIPFYWKDRWYCLIANVAVHPDFRRRGIGRALTQAALDHLRSLRFPSAWLHVREENSPAYDLYRSLNFIERSRRTTWISSQPLMPFFKSSQNLSLNKPSKEDWGFYKPWLEQNYPSEVAWNLGFDLDNFQPNLFPRLLNFLNGRDFRLFILRNSKKLIGMAAWEPSRQYADTIWLGVSTEDQYNAITHLLPMIHAELKNHRPLTINYPAGQAEEPLRHAGYSLQNKLIWMEAPLNRAL